MRPEAKAPKHTEIPIFQAPKAPKRSEIHTILVPEPPKRSEILIIQAPKAPKRSEIHTILAPEAPKRSEILPNPAPRGAIRNGLSNLHARERLVAFLCISYFSYENMSKNNKKNKYLSPAYDFLLPGGGVYCFPRLWLTEPSARPPITP